MAASRCTRCNLNWPVYAGYEHCPGCEDLTWIDPKARPMDVAAARVTAAQLRFERFYWDVWEPRRRQRGEPLPEMVGRREARELLRRHQAEINTLEAAL